MLQNLLVNSASTTLNLSNDGGLDPEKQIGETEFSMLASGMSAGQNDVLPGTELAAFVQQLAIKSGEKLPLEAQVADLDGASIASGEALLAFLMASSGSIQGSASDDELAKIEKALATAADSNLLANAIMSLTETPSDLGVSLEGESERPNVELNADASLMNATTLSEGDDVVELELEDGQMLVGATDQVGETLLNELATKGDESNNIPPVALSFSVRSSDQESPQFKVHPLADGVSLSTEHPLSNMAASADSELVQVNADLLKSQDSEMNASEIVQATLIVDRPSGSILSDKSLQLSVNVQSEGEVTEDGLELMSKPIDVKVGTTKEADKPPVVPFLAANADPKENLILDGKLTQTAVENKEIDASLEDIDTVADKGSRPILEQTQTVFQRAAIKPTAELQLVAQQDVFDRPMKLAEAANALSDKIHTLIRGEMKHAIIRLDPPELGSLEVRVQVQNDQTQVQIISQSAQVREALEQQSARLRESLAQQGLTMANLDVSDQPSQGQTGGSSDGSGGDQGIEDGDVNDVAEVIEVKTPIGLVDHYV